MRTFVTVAFGIATLAAPALAAEAPAASKPEIIEGPAVALDGDTIQIDGRRIRLFGIAAPEMTDALGPQARGRLDDTLATGPVRCAVVDTDRQRHPIAICKRGGVDLAKQLLESGLATTYRIFTHAKGADPYLAARYDAAERNARYSGAGLWADDNILPTGFWRNVERFQTLIAGMVAVIGGIGVFFAAKIGLNGIREQIEAAHRTEEQRAAQERLALLESLVAEVEMFSYMLKTTAREARNIHAEIYSTPPTGSTRYRERLRLPPATIYVANAARIGLIGTQLASKVAHVYGLLTHREREVAARNEGDLGSFLPDYIRLLQKTAVRFNQVGEALREEIASAGGPVPEIFDADYDAVTS